MLKMALDGADKTLKLLQTLAFGTIGLKVI